MTDPLEQGVLSFLGGYKPPAPKPADPLEKDVTSFLSGYKPPAPPKPKPATTRDPILDRLPPALAADFEKRPEFAAKLAKDRAAGLTDDQILAKIAVGQQVKPRRPAWAANAPSTAEAQPDVLYGQPSGMETAVEAGLRGVAATKGNVGALMERFGRKAELPPEDPKMDAAHEEALAKARAIYGVGSPGASLTPVAETIARPVIENVTQPMVQKGEAIQRESEAEQQALSRPKYARNFVEGLKTDPFKTLAISGIENLPQLATTIGAAAISPELGLGAAWAQETGGAYQEAKQRGATEEEAQTISGIVGATNMFLEYLPAGKALETLGGATRSGVKGFLYDLLEQAVSEGATESIQEANQMVVESAMSAHDQGFTFDQFRDRVLEAGLSAFVLGGATGVAVHTGAAVSDAAQDEKPMPTENGGREATTQERQPVEEPIFKSRIPLDRPLALPRQGVISPEELPFKLANLPLTRWTMKGEEDSGHPIRGGQFWSVGDSTAYYAGGSEGGYSATQEVYTPKRPLVVVGDKEVVAEQLAPPPREPLPDEAESAVAVAEEARARGRAIAMRVAGEWHAGLPNGSVENYGDGLGGQLRARAVVDKANGPGSIYDVNDLRASQHYFADRVLTDYARTNGHDSVVLVNDSGVELIKLDPSDKGIRVPLSQKVKAALASPPAAAVEYDGLDSLFEPREQSAPQMSDSELEADVNDFLSRREEPAITPVERRIEPQPIGEPRERRSDIPTRKLVSQMTDEEKTTALLTSEATGLPNRRAWEEQAANKPVHIAIDADGLKWVNDRFGHDTGTQLLRSLGEAIGPLGAYHLQGDEFAMAADTIEEAEARARQIDEALAGNRLRYTADDGSTYEIPIGASYGIGETYATADRRSLEAKTEREARGQRAPRGEAPPGLVVFPPAGREAGVDAEGGLSANVQMEGRPAGVRADEPRAGQLRSTDSRLRQSDSMGTNAGNPESVGATAEPGLPAPDRRAGEAPVNQTAAPEPRAQEPPPESTQSDEIVARDQPARQEPQQQAPEPSTLEAVPEPAPERDRGPESLPARLVRPRLTPGQEGFAVVPSAIKKPIVDWVKKRFTQQGLAPAYYLDLKIKRDNQLAAKAARLDAYSIDLARAIRRYKGPLTPTQLKIYLDDAYRGMNLSGISGPMDQTQIGRIERRGRPALEGEGRQDVKSPAVDLSEQALQRLREDSPGSKFPREVRPPDQSSIGRQQLREMASRQGVSEDALVSIARKESGQSVAAAPEFLPLLREMRSAQDDLARTLRRYGLLDDASIQQLEREFGLYVHRQYEAPRNPKYLKWIKNQPLWRRAYDLTKSLWDRQFAADRAEMIVDDLKLRRPPASGPLRQGEEVEIAAKPRPKKAPAPEGEEELARAALVKAGQLSSARQSGPDDPENDLARPRATVPRRQSEHPLAELEAQPTPGRAGVIVQVKGSEVFVETADGDGRRETVPVPKTQIKRKFGTKAQAIADVRRTMLDPSTRDQFLENYQLDADTFGESHVKAREAMPDMPENEIWGMLHSYVESSGNRPVLPGGVPEGSKDMTALKRRGRKDDLERLLKSEVRSVDWNFLTTTLKMATIVAQHRFLVDLERAGKGDIFVEKPEVRNAGTDKEQSLTKPVDPGFYAKSIENAKGREPGIDQRIIMQGNKKMAPLADLFTTDEMMEALNQAFDQKSNAAWLRWYMRGVIMAKGAATAKSLISLMRNVWSQPLAVSANGVNPFNLRRFMEAGKLSYPRAVGSTDRTRLARMERYIELGIVDQGTDVGDIKRMENRAQVLREDVPHGAGHLGGRIIRETGRGVMKLYEAPDNQGKIEVFEALLPLYKKAFPEMSTKEVEEHLAAKQRNTMQNYSMTPPLVKDISQFPFIGSFVSFRMESIRNLYNAIKVAAEEVWSDNPELKKIGLRRTAGIAFALASTGAIASALRYWHNMDDDDDEAIRRFMAPWNKNSQVAFLHSIDEDGNVAFIDLSFMDYYSAVKTPFHALLRGDLAGVRDSILDPFGEDVFTKNVMDIWARGGKTKEGFDVYNQQDSTLTKSIEITKHLGAPLTPGVVKQAARVLDPERDRSSEILGLFGVRKTVVNVPKELRRRAKSFQDAINDSRWIEKKVIRKPGTEDAYAEAQRRSEVALRRNIEEFIRDIQAARQLGLPESEIAAALIESGFSKGNPAKGRIGDAGLLLGGEVDALVQRYQNLNEKWGEEKRNLRTPKPHNYPRTSDEVDATGAKPYRYTTMADIARAAARGESHYPPTQPTEETELQKKNRREIGETAKIWQGTLKERGIEQPNGEMFGLGEYFVGKEIERQGVNQNPDTAMERLGAAGRRSIKEKGPEIGRRLGWARTERSLLDGFTTESTDRMTEILKTARTLYDKGIRGSDFWSRIGAMYNDKSAFGE